MPNALITPAGLRIIRQLAGRPPQTIAELAAAAGVTRTAVAEQLDELQTAGLVERTTDLRGRRGRPRHLYRAADAAMTLVFPGNPRLVVSALWRVISDVGGEKLTQKIAKRLSRAMADYYNSKITAKTPRDRLRQLIALLTAEGGLADVVEEKDDRWTLYRRSCPFLQMADKRLNVCRVDIDFLSAVVGCPVRRTASRIAGAPCCTFEIVDE
jgi:predicted ArsR family transcriptional regulator